MTSRVVFLVSPSATLSVQPSLPHPLLSPTTDNLTVTGNAVHHGDELVAFNAFLMAVYASPFDRVGSERNWFQSRPTLEHQVH